jgi:hypothetical protein
MGHGATRAESAGFEQTDWAGSRVRQRRDLPATSRAPGAGFETSHMRRHVDGAGVAQTRLLVIVCRVESSTSARPPRFAMLLRDLLCAGSARTVAAVHLPEAPMRCLSSGSVRGSLQSPPSHETVALMLRIGVVCLAAPVQRSSHSAK